MTLSAQTIRDRVVRDIEESGFVAAGLHVRVGEDIAEFRWRADERAEIHSVTKAISVFAAAIASNEGLVSLDAPLSSYDLGIALGDGVGDVTLRHLLTMSSGIDLPWTPTLMTDWPDLAVEFLGRPSQGRVFQYSNASSYAAMTVLASRTGDVFDYLVPRLFQPLGLDAVHWERCAHGRVLAGEGIALRTEELSRIGQLIRDRGAWDGQQLVPAAIIDQMHSDWVVAGETDGYDRYALSGWGGPGAGWRLHGAYGQLIIFAGDAVVTMTADDHLNADATAAAVVAICTATD